MASLGLVDLTRRSEPVAEERKKKWNPAGERGKLHRELGISEGEKIPQARLAAAVRSSDPEVRRDAIRAKTMEGWAHGKDAANRRYSR